MKTMEGKLVSWPFQRFLFRKRGTKESYKITICFQTQMYEDFSADHANKTITMETHPHLPGPPQVCASACKSSCIDVLISIHSPFGCNLLTNQFWSGKRPSLQACSDHEETSWPGKHIFSLNVSSSSSCLNQNFKFSDCGRRRGAWSSSVPHHFPQVCPGISSYYILICTCISVWSAMNCLEKSNIFTQKCYRKPKV